MAEKDEKKGNFSVELDDNLMFKAVTDGEKVWMDVFESGDQELDIEPGKKRAKELIDEACLLPSSEGRIKAKEAIELYPNCIEAYEYLALTEVYPQRAIHYYKKGMEIGRRLFTGENLPVYEGRFWTYPPTRPFMRCSFHYAECLNFLGKKRPSIAILEELLFLCPEDHMGARDPLMVQLLGAKEFEKFANYSNAYSDIMRAFPLFNSALYTFLTEGENENAAEKLKLAMEKNPFVAEKLISKGILEEAPEMYEIGNENEADYYVADAREVWQKSKGAIEWLKKNV